LPYESLTRATDVAAHIDTLPSRRREMYPEIQDPAFWTLFDKCKAYSLVHIPGFYNVYRSMQYIARNELAGNLVECGCFLGGMAMFVGLLRAELGLRHKEIVLFDTFVGAPVGSTDTVHGETFIEREELPRFRDTTALAIEEVVGSLEGYRLVEGLAETTVPQTETGELALLRLDTDYYTSTRVELEVLYPRLVAGGVLVIDDYGMFEGARRATDEYFHATHPVPMLNRIDGSVWAGIKPG
jgi:O-methyltransferase